MSILITIIVIAFVALFIWYCIVPTSPPSPPPSLPPQLTHKRPTLQIGTVDQKRRCNACGTHNTIEGLRTVSFGPVSPAEEKERQRHHGPARFTCTSCGSEQEIPNPRGMCYIDNRPASVSSGKEYLGDAGAGCLTVSAKSHDNSSYSSDY